MDSSDGIIWVYRYRYWDPARNEMLTARREATLEAIRNGLGIPVVESGRRVSLDAIDRQGRVVDAAGELDR